MSKEQDKSGLLENAKNFWKSLTGNKEEAVKKVETTNKKLKDAKDYWKSQSEIKKPKKAVIFSPEKAEKKAEEAKKNLRKHVVKSDETLSHIALKYYGSAIKEKWMIIYEANKDVIGDNPNIIRPGIELVIPELKDK